MVYHEQQTSSKKMFFLSVQKSHQSRYNITMKATKQHIKKIYQALLTSKVKYLTADMLAEQIGIYPELINDACALFNPLVTMDPTFNLLDLIDDVKHYVQTLPTTRREPSTLPKKRDIESYGSFVAFIYEKMTIAGIVDKAIILSDTDLKLAKKLIQNELKARKK